MRRIRCFYIRIFNIYKIAPIWNHWQIANPEIADQVPVESDLTIWRPMDIAFTYKGKGDADTRAFARFLTSSEARAIFESQGWKR